MKRLFLFLFLLIFGIGCKNSSTEDKKEEKDYTNYNNEALEFIRYRDLSEDFYILVDFSIHSGKNRMFLINPKTGKVLYSTLTTHGMGSEGNYSEEENVKFSNTPHSHSSSKGKYILGSKRVYSPGYRYKYILYGQETTNSNAAVRDVVFHPWNVIPNTEVYPQSIAQSWGCPAVSERAFDDIHAMIQSTSKRILFWIVN